MKRKFSSYHGVIILALVLFVPIINGISQSVVLHLRGGDRVTGIIVSEDTNQVTLSNVWSAKLVVPLAQIESREAKPPAPVALPVGLVLPAPTNAVAAKLPAAKTTAAPTNAPWFKHWKGELAVGLTAERGAADTQLYFGKGSATYTRPYEDDPKESFRNTFNYSAEYGRTGGVLSDNQMTGSSKTDFDLSRRYYVYNLGAASYDEIQKIAIHYEDGPGAGYHWFTRTNFLVNLELGANYQVDHYTDDTSIDTFYYRVGEDLTWKLRQQLTITEKFAFYPRSTNPGVYRAQFEGNLSYALLAHLALNLTVIDNYDTNPALTVPKNDLQVRTTLGLKF